MVFLFFSDFFRILSKNFSDLWPKNFKKLSKLPSACADEQFLAWRNFQKFWTVMVFLQKPLAWFSEFYLSVQSKISGRNSFLNFSFQKFFQFRAKYFQTFVQKNFKKLSNLPSACSDEQFLAWNFFQKFWTILDFLQKPLAWFSNFYLRVQSKNSGRIIFFILLFRNFFGFWAKKIQTFGQKFSRSFQNYLLSVQRNSLWLEIFF